MNNINDVEKNLISSYHVIKYNKKYINPVIKLFFESHRRKKSRAFFNYGLTKTPYGNPIIYLMKYSNQIVGYHSLRPLLLKIKNKSVLGGLSYNTMTHPDYRNKGIFSILAKKTAEEAKKQKYEFVLGFANSNSSKGYEKIGHKFIPINYVKINKVNFNVKKTPKVREHYFPKNLGKINKNYLAKKDYPIRIEKDDKFLIWRYKINPEWRYLTCFKSNEYFFIFKKYRSALQIIDFFGGGPEFYKTLIATALNTAKKLCCNEVSMWIPKNHPIMNILRGKAVTHLKPSQFFHILALNKRIQPLLYEQDNWHYTMGDSDVF